MTTNGQLGQLSKIIFVAGRFLVGGFYLMAGIGNLLNLETAAGYTAMKGVSNPTFWVTIASLLLVLGGASLLTGIRPSLGVAALALFLVPVTVIMHNFWAMEGMQAQLEMRAFMSNMGLLGSAILLLAIPQPWAVSLDKWVLSIVAALGARGERSTRQQPTAQDTYAIK
jgi:uncharacterized membrane protein YphA (DoxX/SURF4 family)